MFKGYKKSVLICTCILMFTAGFSGCSKSSESFDVSDFIENGLHQSVETVFERYGWKLDAASQEDNGSGQVTYTAAETIQVGDYQVSPELTFQDGECTAFFYQVDLPQDIDTRKAYDFLMEQSEMAREEVGPYCDLESEEMAMYATFPDDTYPTFEEFDAAVQANPTLIRTWIWLLSEIDPSGSLVSSANLFLYEEGNGQPYYTFYVNEMSR